MSLCNVDSAFWMSNTSNNLNKWLWLIFSYDGENVLTLIYVSTSIRGSAWGKTRPNFSSEAFVREWMLLNKCLHHALRIDVKSTLFSITLLEFICQYFGSFVKLFLLVLSYSVALLVSFISVLVHFETKIGDSTLNFWMTSPFCVWSRHDKRHLFRLGMARFLVHPFAFWHNMYVFTSFN